MTRLKLPIEIGLRFANFEEIDYLIKYLRESNPNKRLTVKLSNQLNRLAEQKKVSIAKKKASTERKAKNKAIIATNLAKRKLPKIKKFEKGDLIDPDFSCLTASVEFRNQLIEGQTESEKIIKAHLKSIGAKFEFQHVIFVDNYHFFIVDFFLPDYNIVIEIDGKYHEDKWQVVKDKDRTDRLRDIGVKRVERLTNFECEPTDFTRNKLIKILNKYSK